MRRTITKKIIELFKKHEHNINNIQNQIATIIENEDEEYQQQLVLMLITAIANGYEKLEDQKNILEASKTLLEELNNEKNKEGIL